MLGCQGDFYTNSHQQQQKLQPTDFEISKNSAIMGKFIALVDSAPSAELQINEDLLESFMKKVTVWDYYNITKERYLALSWEKKENHIKQDYIEMVVLSSDGKSSFLTFLILIFLIFLVLVWDGVLKITS